MSGLSNLFGGDSNKLVTPGDGILGGQDGTTRGGTTTTTPVATPPAPAAPSAAEKLVDAEQQRTEAQRIDSIQRQLRLETASNSRGYGLRSLFGSLGPQRNSLLGSG
jgi:hypothetical protein